MTPWPKGLRERMARVRAAAEARHDTSTACVVELHGRWYVRSLDERRWPTPWWEGDSLEAAETHYLKSQPQVAGALASGVPDSNSGSV